jgi:predicted Zn-dependent peptidase
MELDLKEEILSNGIKLVSVKKDTSLFSAQIGVKAGSLNEKRSEKGYAHFIEHMMFKGTKNRSNQDINYDLESIGGDSNAFTDYTYTVYSITALKEDIKSSLDLLSDMLINPTFKEEEIQKEKGVVLSEIKAAKDDIEDLSFSLVNNLAFSKSGLKYDILGTENVIGKIERKKIINFYSKYYVPSNTVISITSPYEHSEIKSLAEGFFKSWESRIAGKTNIINEKNNYKTKIVRRNDIEQCCIIYLYTFNGFTKEEEMALKILNYKLSDSTNSILFQRLREDTGLVYDVYTQMDTLTNVKTFYIYTQVSIEGKEEAERILNQSISDILERKIRFDDKTITSMKKSLKNALANTLENTGEIADFCLYKAIEGEKIESLQQEIDKLSNISEDDIYKAAEKLFDQGTVHIIIPR